MAFWEAVRTTLAEIWAHKLRSSLTLIGILLGSTAVVVLVTMIEGIKVMVWDGFESLGYDGVMFVSAQAPEDVLERRKRFLSRGLTPHDMEVLEQGGRTFHTVAGLRIQDTVMRARGEDRRVRVHGVSPSYADVRNRTVTAGRWLVESDGRQRRRVAVLGAELATAVFGSDDPVGANITLGGTVFQVVGVQGRIGNQMTNDGGWSRREMNGALVPLETFEGFVRGGRRVNLLMIKTDEREHLDRVEDEITRLLRASHAGIQDFRVEDVASEMVRAARQVRQLLRNWTIVMASIAGISLLVGGVGIYSVLKISLAERLFEIGLRKAMGAPDRAILTQFLVESTTLSVAGGLLGCALGALVAGLASSSFEAGLPLAPLGLALAISFAVSVGIFAGIFPSLAASRLTPVEALRG